MNARWITILLSFAICACHSTQDEGEPTAIPKKELIALLAEIHLEQASAQSIGLQDTVIRLSAVERVLSRAHIPLKTYTSTMDYYGSHPAELSKLYDSVIEELTKKQAEQHGNSKRIHPPMVRKNSSAQ
jgi:hypothetical protein